MRPAAKSCALLLLLVATPALAALNVATLRPSPSATTTTTTLPPPTSTALTKQQPAPPERAAEIATTVFGCLGNLAADQLQREAGETARIRPALEQLGPTFVKFGQALANRPDIVGAALADELRGLQDDMSYFSTADARVIIAEDLGAAATPILAALPAEPVAAASIGQVYKVVLEDGTALAVKVQRPDAAELCAQDLALARSVAGWLETLRSPTGGRLLRPAVLAGVEEFFGRLSEEMDYATELQNLRDFDALYGRGGPAAKVLRRQAGGGEIVTPRPRPELCSARVLTMTWVEGTPLLGKGSAVMQASELPLLLLGLRCTLSQLLETGVMHADPHAGNLLRLPPAPPTAVGRWRRRLSPRRWGRAVRRRRGDADAVAADSATGSALASAAAASAAASAAAAAAAPPRLAYLDFGLVSRVPLQVRDIASDCF